MKTISGHCVSVKDVSLSKATKILSKFVSADNGASHAINAYLRRASASFKELNQLHKKLDSSPVKENHKKLKSEIGSGNVGLDDEKSSHRSVKFSHESNGSVEYQTESVTTSGKHSKNKKSDKVEGRPEDRSVDLSKNRVKRKRGSDL